VAGSFRVSVLWLLDAACCCQNSHDRTWPYTFPGKAVLIFVTWLDAATVPAADEEIVYRPCLQREGNDNVAMMVKRLPLGGVHRTGTSRPRSDTAGPGEHIATMLAQCR